LNYVDSWCIEHGVPYNSVLVTDGNYSGDPSHLGAYGPEWPAYWPAAGVVYKKSWFSQFSPLYWFFLQLTN